MFILEAAKTFIKSRNLEGKVFVSELLIQEILLDYFSDIKRLKDFHQIEKTNSQKIASFTTYWVFRRKPLQIKNDLIEEVAQEKKEFLKQVNEWFACALYLAILYDRSKTPSDTGPAYRRFIKNFNYFLIYRYVSPQALELVADALETESMYPIGTDVIDKIESGSLAKSVM
ncbi:hypothetical protein LEP1GSC168_0015 [Leptospira santarosai str. HAI134]|nr:hypothetical protein LEP1GSC168_0015 [Leptospira santarosai str. HAI134]